MRLTSLLLAIVCMHVSATTLSQTVTLNVSRQPITQVLASIKAQTGYLIVYNDRYVTQDLLVSLNVKDERLEAVLDEVLKPRALTYQIKGKTIAIRGQPGRRNIKEDVPEAPMLHQRIITGKVTDESGQPLEGVTVAVKGTSLAVTTNDIGNYQVELPTDGNTLVFTIVGFEAVERLIGDLSTISVSMRPSVSDLDEVVVIGYGAVKKRDLTGSVTSVKGEDLNISPVTSLDQGLQGRAAGVQVLQSSGQPGSTPRIRIRGTNSINAGGVPLYVIDGFPISLGATSGNILPSNAGFNPLSAINPQDIESVEVLKDASATAIYGSRASNGVVIVTTKRGKLGKPIVNFNSYYGLQSIAKKIDLLDGAEYAIVQNEAFTRRGLALRYTQEAIDSLRINGGTDWQNELYSAAAPIQEHGISVTGGTEGTKYAFSAGYFSQDGLIINSGFDRTSVKLNLDQKINNKLSFGTNFSYNNSNSDLAFTNSGGSANGGVSFRALNEDPTKPVYTLDGEFNYDKGGLFWGGNLIADTELIESKALSDRLLGNAFIDWQIFEDLTAKAVFGIDVMNNEERYFRPSELFRSGGRALASLAKIRNFTWLNDYTVTYHKIFNDTHDLNLVVGSSIQSTSTNSLTGTTNDLITEELKYYNLSNGLTPSPPGSGFSDFTYASFFARANYIFWDKYLLTLTGRFDGSSKFGAGNKWGFFPAIAFAWRLGDEEFIQSLNTFSDLKLRASYGSTGNSGISPFLSQQLLTRAYYQFDNQTVIGYGPSATLANPNLGWESTAQWDIGLDVGLADNRINATVDFYHKMTYDLLFNITVPPSSGKSTSQKNLGKMLNKGVDFSIRTVNIDNGRLRWSTEFNVSRNINRVLDLGGPEIIFFSTGSARWVGAREPNVLKVGQPLGVFYGYLNDGIIQLGEENNVPKISGMPDPQPGYHKFVDMDGDNLITQNDRTLIGDPNPDFTGGMTNTLSYKGIGLSFALVGAQGFDIFSHTKSEMLSGRGERNSHRDILKAWSETNPSNTIPINGIADNLTLNIYREPMSWYVEDGSYLRLQNITLSYELPYSILNRVKATYAKLYVSANNIHTFSGYHYGYDPEVNINGNSNTLMGNDYDTYPRAKSFLLGITLSF